MLCLQTPWRPWHRVRVGEQRRLPRSGDLVTALLVKAEQRSQTLVFRSERMDLVDQCLVFRRFQFVHRQPLGGHGQLGYQIRPPQCGLNCQE
jgi:hypothetical protein